MFLSVCTPSESLNVPSGSTIAHPFKIERKPEESLRQNHWETIYALQGRGLPLHAFSSVVKL